MQWQQMEVMKYAGVVLLVMAVGVEVVMVADVLPTIIPVLPAVPAGLAVVGIGVAVLGLLLQKLRIRSINSGSAEALHRRLKRE